MLYLIQVDTRLKGRKPYKIFESESESTIMADLEILRELLKGHNLKAVNFSIESEELKIKEWPTGIKIVSNMSSDQKSDFVLLKNISGQRFKVVSHDGVIRYFEQDSIKDLIRHNKIANCCSNKTPDGVEYKSIDAYRVTEDIKFKEQMQKKYNEFRAKVAALGYNIQFKYEIENKEVKLINYTGTSKKVILPRFITTIREEAFKFTNIDEITLNKGLKYIGNSAFLGNSLSSIAIPETVRFVGEDAWASNKGPLFIPFDKPYDKNAVRILNRHTFVYDIVRNNIAMW